MPILSTTQTDEHPIIDSGSIVSTSLLSMLGHLRHGTRRSVQFAVVNESEIQVNFEVNDAMRPILSVKKGADTGALTIHRKKDHPRHCSNSEVLEICTKLKVQQCSRARCLRQEHEKKPELECE